MSRTISNEQFIRLKGRAKEIWSEYDNTYGYVSEKLSTLDKLENIGDNYGTIIGMFDHHNQKKLYDTVDQDLKVLIDEWVGGLDRVLKLAEKWGL